MINQEPESKYLISLHNKSNFPSDYIPGSLIRRGLDRAGLITDVGPNQVRKFGGRSEVSCRATFSCG